MCQLYDARGPEDVIAAINQSDTLIARGNGRPYEDPALNLIATLALEEQSLRGVRSSDRPSPLGGTRTARRRHRHVPTPRHVVDIRPVWRWTEVIFMRTKF
jgi:hypothetical protein